MASSSKLLLSAPFVAIALGAQTSEPSITFAEQIAPILLQNCVGCHQPDGIGPFSLVTYDEVSRRARQIAEVTASGYMPPWKPAQDQGPSLIGERRLTAAEIAILSAWHDADAPAGDLSQIPPPPENPEGWQLGPPDLIVELPTPYSLPGDGIDVYRNFAIPLPLTSPRYVRAVEFRPGTRLAIHHALLLLDDTGRARERDEAEPGPGYDGMGIGSGIPPSGHIVGWTPGQAPYEAFPGTSWEVSPGTDLVLQLHMLPTGRDEPIAPKIGLYFAAEPPSLQSFVFQLRNFDIEIPAGESNYKITENITIPVPVKVLSLYPHAHYLGKDLQLFAMLPNGEKQWLLHIPDWDFNWQGDYRLQTPLSLPAGTVLHIHYTYDNSAANPFNPSSPPVAVRGGWSSRDEMAEAMIQVIPEDPTDLPQLIATQKNYDIAMAGGEARYHYFNGLYLEQQGEFAQAATAFITALQLDPTFASTHFKLGTLAERQGDVSRARDYYQTALHYQSNMISARLALARLLMQDRDFAEAGKIIRETYQANPGHLMACLFLTRFLLSTGETDAALAAFAQNLSTFADSAQFQLEYGEALWRLGQIDAAKARLTAAATIVPADLKVGSAASLKAIQATAYYDLALIQRDETQLAQALESIEHCLTLSPTHLDALLLATELAINTNDHAQALTRLTTLVSLPDDETFYPQDILDNLPLPTGPVLLVDAYLAAQKPAQALQIIDLAIPRLIHNGFTTEATRLRNLQTQR